MTNPMLAELDEVVRLMDAAPDCGWCDGSGEEEDDSSVGCGDRSCCSPAMTSCGECFGTGKRQGKVLNSSVFAFLRTHHATLADMAKRLEAAERDAAKFAPCLWVQDADDGSWDTACGNKHLFIEGDAADNLYLHCPYCGGHLIEPNYDAAIDATQEGEG